MGKIVLIDGHSILNRAFYGVPELTNSEGLHTNAVFGFLNIMFRVLEDEKADYLAVAFDLKEPTFRHKMFEAYKGTRKPMPEELREQVPLIKEVLASMGIPLLTKPGYEADDILGTVARRCGEEGTDVSIVSGDRDLLQLADERIKIRMPRTSKGVTQIKDYYPEDVKREYQVTPKEFIDVKALMGDASDNIPGVPSIGEKTATSLIVSFGSIENAYAHIDEVKPPRARKALGEHYDMAKLCKELVTICTDCAIDFSLADAEIGNLFTPGAYRLMKRLEFKSLLQKFGQDAVSEEGIETKFRLIAELSEAEAIFERALKGPEAGAQLVTEDGDVVALALCLGGEEIYAIPASGFMTGAYLAGKLEEICRSAPRVSALDLKAQLPYLKSTDRTVVDGLRNAQGEEALFDAGVAGYLLNPLKDTYDYDDLARDYLGMTVPSRADLLGKTSFREAFAAGDEKAKTVVCYMGYVAFKSRAALEERLLKAGMRKLFYEIEMPVIYSLYHMEEEGITVRRGELKAYGDRLQVQIERLEQEIFSDTGCEFNINSPKQLGEILFEKMKMPGGKKTKTGYSTAADVLEKLAPDYPVVRKILDYRQVAKLKSTYADGLAAFIREDGRIHGTFHQTITATGRISSAEPNLQNIPVRMELGREIRRLFVPGEGCVLVDADYSQIELRVLAHMSGDENLIGAYRKAEDIHAITASEVFHVPLSEVTPLLRRNAKAVNFGIVYGISAFGLSEDLSISRKEALDYINRYFETYPQVKQFLDGLVETGKTCGYVETMFGRRRPIPELKSANFMQRSFGERAAMNSPIQGTAADIIKIAMIRVDQRLRREGLRSRLVLQVHDELLIETRKEEMEAVRNILEEEMRGAASLKVALEIDMKTGDSWFETK
ncbi:DNA polymerase I [Clostridiaceae bacterium]|nr:DNA polymerase I [Clostridiaceae bacterium]